MAEGTPVTYEELTEELKKKYDEVKAILEADLIGSFHRTRSHGVVERVLTRRRARWSGPVRPSKNAPGPCVRRNHEASYSPSGPALGTYQGEMPLQSRPPLPFALAAPEVPSSPAYVVYKIGGDPSDYQFLHEAPKEIPHGYTCTYVRRRIGHSQTDRNAGTSEQQRNFSNRS
ncbi:hypothetical protein QYE76_060593 [Lolium multiflorum]|uniref:Uncharacterized protein n=1 Tax=Lolium multiflorum TaxID=4521 RepID=A0AAD8S0Q5_LOLMU|nr:hypothetical protein QYE76_060593 [Lolium multiflorum]